MHSQEHTGRRFLTAAAALFMALTMSACSSQVTGICRACRQEKKLNTVTVTVSTDDPEAIMLLSALGMPSSGSGTVDLCDDCVKELQQELKDNGISKAVKVSSHKKTK